MLLSLFSFICFEIVLLLLYGSISEEKGGVGADKEKEEKGVAR